MISSCLPACPSAHADNTGADLFGPRHKVRRCKRFVTFLHENVEFAQKAMDSNSLENVQQHHACACAFAMRTNGDGQGFIAAHPQPLDYIKPSRQPNL